MHGVQTVNTPSSDSYELPMVAKTLNAISWWTTIALLALLRYPLVWLVNTHDWLVTKHNARVSKTEQRYKFCGDKTNTSF